DGADDEDDGADDEDDGADDEDDGNSGDDVPDDDPEEFNAGVDGVLFGNPQISDSVLLTKLSLGLSGLQNCFTCSGVSPCEF
ncbi:MAG: hypothetical protein WCA39_03295, partial [Nitrososphaeraceae archaeon]